MFVTSFLNLMAEFNAFVMRLDVFWAQQQSLGSFWNRVSSVEPLQVHGVFRIPWWFNVFDVCVCVFFVCVRMRVCARTVAVDGQVCEYARVKVCVRVRWCMSASVRSHVWAMVYVCASARACLDYLWCFFV